VTVKVSRTTLLPEVIQSVSHCALGTWCSGLSFCFGSASAEWGSRSQWSYGLGPLILRVSGCKPPCGVAAGGRE